eukprot:TRINITY_DN124022_c0_g1_i1.p1 TRINITY_DN124022_c0_g1~~TRINITY_DN124022_c0_g1_i1.p1  ORF type:complete len:157 (+),score=23.61 TRINITY_DN124022_c0_g1_i1:89-559(+)
MSRPMSRRSSSSSSLSGSRGFRGSFKCTSSDVICDIWSDRHVLSSASTEKLLKNIEKTQWNLARQEAPWARQKAWDAHMMDMEIMHCSSTCKLGHLDSLSYDVHVEEACKKQKASRVGRSGESLRPLPNLRNSTTTSCLASTHKPFKVRHSIDRCA